MPIFSPPLFIVYKMEYNSSDTTDTGERLYNGKKEVLKKRQSVLFDDEARNLSDVRHSLETSKSA